MEENEKNLSQNNGLSNQVTSFPVLVGGPYIFSVFMVKICTRYVNVYIIWGWQYVTHKVGMKSSQILVVGI